MEVFDSFFGIFYAWDVGVLLVTMVYEVRLSIIMAYIYIY